MWVYSFHHPHIHNPGPSHLQPENPPSCSRCLCDPSGVCFHQTITGIFPKLRVKVPFRTPPVSHKNKIEASISQSAPPLASSAFTIGSQVPSTPNSCLLLSTAGLFLPWALLTRTYLWSRSYHPADLNLHAPEPCHLRQAFWGQEGGSKKSTCLHLISGILK